MLWCLTRIQILRMRDVTPNVCPAAWVRILTQTLESFNFFLACSGDQASEDQPAACVSQTWQGAVVPRWTWPRCRGDMMTSETFRILTSCHLSSMCEAWAHILPLLDPAGVGTQINQALASLRAIIICNTKWWPIVNWSFFVFDFQCR